MQLDPNLLDAYERTEMMDRGLGETNSEYNQPTPYEMGRQQALLEIDEMLNDAIIETYTQARFTSQVKVRELITKIKLKYGLLN